MTFIGVDVAPAGSERPIVSLSGGPLSPRLLTFDAQGARIAVVGTSALLLGGDHVQIDLRVGAGAWLEVVDTAGTVAYGAAGQPSSWTVRIQIAVGGRLWWNAEPLVVAAGANVTRTTTIDLAAGAVACLRETIVLGRTGERGGGLRSHTRVHQGGVPILVEDLDLSDPLVRELPGILGGDRIVDSALLFGCDTVAEWVKPGAQVFKLARGGWIARYLGADLHRSAIPNVYANWVNAANSVRAMA